MQPASATQGPVVVAITGGFGVFSTTMASAAHRPHATKLLIPLEGELQVHLTDEGRTLTSTRPVAIAPEIKHAVPCATPRLTAFIDPESRGASLTEHIKRHAHDGSLILDPERGASLVDAARRAGSQLGDRNALEHFREHCCFGLEWTTAQPEFDPRIRAVLQCLIDEPEHRFKLEDLASLATLSPRWLSKLFKERVGTSLRRYAQWLKLADSVQLACQAEKLTASALAAGFADLPHFSRSVSELMGNPPSQVPFELAVLHEDYFASYRSAPPWATQVSTPPETAC
jgi:AraC-like DNA-binding protein